MHAKHPRLHALTKASGLISGYGKDAPIWKLFLVSFWPLNLPGPQVRLTLGVETIKQPLVTLATRHITAVEGAPPRLRVSVTVAVRAGILWLLRC